MAESCSFTSHTLYDARDPRPDRSAPRRHAPSSSELLGRLRTTLGVRGADCRMIALTGYGQPRDRARALQVGFDGHVTKPVDLEALLRLIRREHPER
jgi:CheY-like chemotaxis protein